MIDTESIDDIMGRMKDGAAGIYDTLATKMSGGEGAESETVKQIKDIVKNLDVMTRQINSLLYKSSDSMSEMMKNLESISGNIAQNNAQITGIIANAEKLTATLSQSDIDGTMKSTKGMMDKANETMAGFDKTLVSAKKSMDELSELFGGMNDSEGTLGKMLKDDQFYDNMTSATRNLDLLLQDFRLNPKRYTTVLKKKSPVYVLPADDPAVKKEVGSNE